MHVRQFFPYHQTFGIIFFHKLYLIELKFCSCICNFNNANVNCVVICRFFAPLKSLLLLPMSCYIARNNTILQRNTHSLPLSVSDHIARSMAIILYCMQLIEGTSAIIFCSFVLCNLAQKNVR